MNYSYIEFNKNLDDIIKNNNLFFFYGENNYFMIKTLDIIYKKINNVLRETIYLWEADIDKFVKLLSTFNLFNKFTMLILRYYNFDEKKNFKKDLINFLKKYKLNNYLFILYEQKLKDVEKADETLMYFLNNSMCVEFNNPTKEELINEFIPQIIGHEISNEIKELLIENTNYDLWLLYNEIEKIKYYVKGKNMISLEDIYECCNSYQERNIYELVNAIETKNFKLLLEVFDKLINQEIYPLQIFVYLYKYFNKKFLLNKIELKKKYKILKELQFTDFKLKTSSNSKLILENFIISVFKIYNGYF